jgi:hypothetical protein
MAGDGGNATHEPGSNRKRWLIAAVSFFQARHSAAVNRIADTIGAIVRT